MNRYEQAKQKLIKRIYDCADDDNSIVAKTAEYQQISRESALYRVMQDDMYEFVTEDLIDEVIELVDAIIEQHENHSDQKEIDRITNNFAEWAANIVG